MTGFLLDTNVISELRKPRPEPRVAAFVAAKPLEAFYVTSVTLAEIRYGIEKLTDTAKRAELTDWLSHRVRPLFEGRILPVSEDAILRWRLMVEMGRKANHTFSQPDLFIAAIAALNGLTVVSRDKREFIKAGVSVISPWDAD